MEEDKTMEEADTSYEEEEGVEEVKKTSVTVGTQTEDMSMSETICIDVSDDDEDSGACEGVPQSQPASFEKQLEPCDDVSNHNLQMDEQRITVSEECVPQPALSEKQLEPCNVINQEEMIVIQRITVDEPCEDVPHQPALFEKQLQHLEPPCDVIHHNLEMDEDEQLKPCDDDDIDDDCFDPGLLNSSDDEEKVKEDKAVTPPPRPSSSSTPTPPTATNPEMTNDHLIPTVTPTPTPVSNEPNNKPPSPPPIPSVHETNSLDPPPSPKHTTIDHNLEIDEEEVEMVEQPQIEIFHESNNAQKDPAPCNWDDIHDELEQDILDEIQIIDPLSELRDDEDVNHDQNLDEEQDMEGHIVIQRITVTVYKCNICLRYDFVSEKQFINHFTKIHKLPHALKCQIKPCSSSEELDLSQKDVDRYEQLIKKPVPGRVYLDPHKHIHDSEEESDSEWEDVASDYNNASDEESSSSSPPSSSSSIHHLFDLSGDDEDDLDFVVDSRGRTSRRRKTINSTTTTTNSQQLAKKSSTQIVTPNRIVQRSKPRQRTVTGQFKRTTKA